MRIAIKIAYNGKNFHGYARQPNLNTVEGELIKALVKYEFIENTKQSIFRSASRTDKDVSAFCNVIAFNTSMSKKQIMENLSNEFSDIIIYGIAEVKSDFNPRYAKMRQYRYYLSSYNLDIENMINTLSYFTGEHNFSNFAKLEHFKNPVRTIDNIVFSLEKDFLIIDFYASTFLWHQIRRIISALEKVGCGKLEREQILAALNNPNDKVDFGLSPAKQLVLMDIIYDFEFDYDDNLLVRFKDFKKRITSSIMI